MQIEEAVKLLREAGWTVEEPITQETCLHPLHMRMGSGSVGSDGSSHSETTCKVCGKHWEWTTPPQPNRYPVNWIQN